MGGAAFTLPRGAVAGWWGGLGQKFNPSYMYFIKSPWPWVLIIREQNGACQDLNRDGHRGRPALYRDWHKRSVGGALALMLNRVSGGGGVGGGDRGIPPGGRGGGGDGCSQGAV